MLENAVNLALLPPSKLRSDASELFDSPDFLARSLLLVYIKCDSNVAEMSMLGGIRVEVGPNATPANLQARQN